MFFVPLMLERLYANAGVVSLTATVTVALPDPPGPVAITVSTLEANVTEDVPEITPVVGLKDKPVGKLLPPLKA